MSNPTSEQIEDFPFGQFEKCVDLGDDHWYKITGCSEGCPGYGTGPHGLIQPHLDRFGHWCGGAVTFRGHGGDGHAEWDVHCLDPLHIEPSLLCRGKVFNAGPDGIATGPIEECGDHGFIRNGRWERV